MPTTIPTDAWLRSLRCAALLALSAASGCAKHDLRGRAVPSPDGKTYLVVEDANGGACGPIRVDGRKWPHATHAPGAIDPGVHRIDCGGASELRLEIRAATTFHFDYWGP